MDGLTRREIEFSLQLVTRLLKSDKSHQDDSVRAYVVGGRDVLKTWEKVPTVIVFCPDETGWRSKSNRVIADELAFANQAIVIIPDIYNSEGSSYLV